MESGEWRLSILRQQVLTSVERLGEYRGILHSRRHLAASPLFKGIPNFRETRIRMLRAETVEELFEIISLTPTLSQGEGEMTLHKQDSPNE